MIEPNLTRRMFLLYEQLASTPLWRFRRAMRLMRELQYCAAVLAAAYPTAVEVELRGGDETLLHIPVRKNARLPEGVVELHANGVTISRIDVGSAE